MALALKGASEEVRDHLLKTMSSRAVEMLKEDMEVLGPVRARDISKAQQETIALARKLEEEGKIVLKPESADESMSVRPEDRAAGNDRGLELQVSDDCSSRVSLRPARRRRRNGKRRIERATQGCGYRSRAAERFSPGRDASAGALAQSWSRNVTPSAKQLEHLPRSGADYFRRVEGDVVSLALAIARKMLHREVQIDPLLLAGSCASR